MSTVDGHTEAIAPLAAGAAAAAHDGETQRGRILQAALELMAHAGAHTVSMRQLARACGLNVATLYHYFPSKADLLRSVIEERNYVQLMQADMPIDRSLPPRPRLAALIAAIWEGALAEEDVWRLLLGESLRSDDVALGVVAELAHDLEEAVGRWLQRLFPELDRDRRQIVTSAVTGQLFGFFVEDLVVQRADRSAYLHRRAGDVAALVFPD